MKVDKEYEQLTMKDLLDPFTGEPVTWDKRQARAGQSVKGEHSKCRFRSCL